MSRAVCAMRRTGANARRVMNQPPAAASAMNAGIATSASFSSWLSAASAVSSRATARTQTSPTPSTGTRTSYSCQRTPDETTVRSTPSSNTAALSNARGTMPYSGTPAASYTDRYTPSRNASRSLSTSSAPSRTRNSVSAPAAISAIRLRVDARADCAPA